MQTIRNLVCLSVLGALWLNGSVHVNLDVTFSFSATALILLAIFRQQSVAAGLRTGGFFLKRLKRGSSRDPPKTPPPNK